MKSIAATFEFWAVLVCLRFPGNLSTPRVLSMNLLYINHKSTDEILTRYLWLWDIWKFQQSSLSCQDPKWTRIQWACSTPEEWPTASMFAWRTSVFMPPQTVGEPQYPISDLGSCAPWSHQRLMLNRTLAKF